jgi:hypothetical protein
MIIAPKTTRVRVDNLEEALLYCKFLEVDGTRGVWRLPTMQEWADSYELRDANDIHELVNCIVDISYTNNYYVNVVIPVRDD